MASSFHDLPAELIESILEEMELKDMCALRMTSHPIANKINNSCFRNHFRRKNLYTTTKCLKAFVTLTRESPLVCLVKDLAIIGISGALNGPFEDVQKRATLLGEALNNIRVASEPQSLHSLSLEVVMRIGGKLVSTDDGLRGSLTKPCKPRAARPVWITTAETFRIASTGLAKSHLLLQELSLFTNVRQCALGCDSFALAVDEELLTVLRGVRRLSLRISAPFPPHKEQYLPAVQPPSVMMERPGADKGKYPLAVTREPGPTSTATQDEDRYASYVGTWLGKFSLLQILEVQWFHVCKPQTPLSRIAFFDQIDRSMVWPGLKELIINNVTASVKEVKDFMSRHSQLTEVTLNHVRLSPADNGASIKSWLMDGDVPFEYMQIYVAWAWPRNELTDTRYLRIGNATSAQHPERYAAQPPTREPVGVDEYRQLCGPPWRLD